MTNFGARLDRLPMTSAHYAAFLALAFAYFFELGDLNTFAYAAPALISQWHIDVHIIAVITSASFGGMFIGALFGGSLANRIGRKRAFILSTLFYSGFSLANALAWDVASVAVLRFVTGIGLSAMTVIANTYIGEFFPARIRGRYMGFTMTIGLVGIPVTAWVARIVVPLAPWGWRLIFIWGALGAVAALIAARMVESPRWLGSQGRTGEAEAITNRLEQLASAKQPLPPPEATRPDAVVRARTSYAAIFRAPHLGRTIMLSVASITGTVGFYGFMSWVPTLLYEHGFSVVKSLTYTSVISICNPLGALLAADLMERFDRKWFNTGVSLVVALCVVLYGLTSDPLMIMVLGALAVIALQGGATGGYIYSSELYSTDVRSHGVGLTYGLGRIANVGGPFIIAAVYSGWGYAAVFATVAVCYVLRGAVYGLFGPLATGRLLETVSPASAGLRNESSGPIRSGTT
jgi:MFS transporter, putative metabolite:H+ symporter